jgi:hypothetical protein
MTQILLDAIGRLHATLETLAGALESGEAGQVLDAEAPLAEAVHQLSALAQRGALDPAALRHGLIAIRVSMLRCQALGRSAGDLADVMSQAGYGSSGARMIARVPGASVTARS